MVVLLSALAYGCTFLLFVQFAATAPTPPNGTDVGIPQTIFDDLVRFTKYSSAVYQLFCPKPLGNTLVASFLHGNKGFVARDDDRHEIIIAFRGSLDPIDALKDISIRLVPLNSPGIANVGRARVHTGFMIAYNLVAKTVIDIIDRQLALFPDYSIVVTGHSLGGAIASLCALSLQGTYPDANLKLYTFGQPRTGDADFAQLVESRIGLTNIFRAVHTNDGVPTIRIQKRLKYQHFSVEYWNFRDPAAPESVKACWRREDPTCSDAIPSLGINPAHIVYFGEWMALNPTLCF